MAIMHYFMFGYWLWFGVLVCIAILHVWNLFHCYWSLQIFCVCQAIQNYELWKDTVQGMGVVSAEQVYFSESSWRNLNVHWKKRQNINRAAEENIVNYL